MKTSVLASLLFGFLLAAASSQQAQAQGKSNEINNSIPWFTVQNQALVVQTRGKAKPLDKDVTLPNGIRIEYRTKSVLLTSGTRVPMKEGDMLSLNGEFIGSHTAVPAPAPVFAQASAPTPAPEPVAPAAPAAPVASGPTFTYRATAPVNGKLRGMVELGASGFNMFIVRVDAQHNWKLEKSEFGNSLVMENIATEDDIRNGLKAYIGKMLDFGVAARDIHFVVSSGAVLSEGTQRIIKSLQALKYVVNTVTPEREGALGLKAALPAEFAQKAFVLDIGSANTKIAWLAGDQPHVEDSFGSKYFQSNTDDATVAADIKAKASNIPAALRGTCFVIGGVPYELAKADRKGQEPFTVLRPANSYSELNGAKTKAGLNIYQAVAEATGCKQFVFGYDANFTIGYLLSLP
ncbi:DUF6799 domain-containing protein [Hymenobacter rubidus]|uniref:DUF6799 domain-containing protein n=1 Tax=Hymenobacter rubidus TaxID=1441626 RepID=UPI00191C926F|nr:DUF6799 domain-containing protein [Hymenobacter rubidus]